MYLSYFLEEVLYFENFDLDNIYTPVKVDKLAELLEMSDYDRKKSEFLVNGFRTGFDLGYRGPKVKLKSSNLKLTVGSKVELWNKLMKEVQLKRIAGPFVDIPYTDSFIQSPIGLVPKDGGRKTRLIFHLSYPKRTDLSVNANISKDLCSVEYPSFDDAVRLCLKCGKGAYLGKSDMTSAFRHLCMNKESWKYLIMKAVNPITGQICYFVDKCLPFGAAISCALFQAFSDAISHIVSYLTGSENINYLDDYFFAEILKQACNQQIAVFMNICDAIAFPVALDKTYWATHRLVFLGLLIDALSQTIGIPIEKVDKAREMLAKVLSKRKCTIRLKQLEQLCGFLNFLCKAVVPGRTFTRRLYALLRRSENKFKKHQHVTLKSDMKQDLRMWGEFLSNPVVYNRSFFDFQLEVSSVEVDFFTDATANPELGVGGICGEDWFVMQWDEQFVRTQKPSINYLELYGLTAGLLLWLVKFKNSSIIIFCDNTSVVHMVNNKTSSCKNCMVLLRIVVLQAMIHNVDVKAEYITSESNIFADSLSRLRYDLFRKYARAHHRVFNKRPAEIPSRLTPMSDIWIKQ